MQNSSLPAFHTLFFASIRPNVLFDLRTINMSYLFLPFYQELF